MGQAAVAHKASPYYLSMFLSLFLSFYLVATALLLLFNLCKLIPDPWSDLLNESRMPLSKEWQIHICAVWEMSGASLTEKHEVDPSFRDTVILVGYIYFVGHKKLKFTVQWAVTDLTADAFWFMAGAKK